MKSLILAILGSILTTILDNVTPAIRDMLESFVITLWVEAKKTTNEEDNKFVKALAKVLKIELPE